MACTRTNDQTEEITWESPELTKEECKKIVVSIKSKIQPRKPSRPSGSIYKVLPIHRKGKKYMYEPQVVSIGPFYHGDKRLRPMEEKKLWYLQAFLSRTSVSLKELVKAINPVGQKARKCYPESIKLSPIEFIKMLLIDGCFILEFLHSYAGNVRIDENDHIFGINSMPLRILQDMALLENQIPLIILDRMFELTPEYESEGKSLNNLVMFCFKDILHTNQSVVCQTMGKHLLELIHNNLLLPLDNKPLDDKAGEYDSVWLIRRCTFSATSLSAAGVTIKIKDKNTFGLLDITFSNNGVLEIPPLIWGLETSILFQNLIALEDYGGNIINRRKQNVTSYIIFMSLLMGSQKDVRLLHRQRIIECYQDYKEVVTGIRKLCEGIYPPKFYYGELCDRLKRYHGTNKGKLRANLKRDHFNTPAGLFLQFVQVLQTIVTILSHLHLRSLKIFK